MKNLLIFLLIIGSFTSCKVYHHASTENVQYDLSSTENISSDSEIENLITPYKEKLDAKMNQVIGNAEKELIKHLPECTLGNWASDAIYRQCNKFYKKPIDFAVVNYGGIRIPSLPQGDITTGKIFELMPFDNMMVVLSVKGDIVQQLFESMTLRGGWPVSSNVKCSFKADGKIINLSINDNPIDMNKMYQIGLSDYIANGGDQCDFFKGKPQNNTGMLFRDAFLNEVKETQKRGENIDAQIEGRMKLIP